MSKINKHFCSHRCYIPEGERQHIINIYVFIGLWRGEKSKQNRAKKVRNARWVGAVLKREFRLGFPEKHHLHANPLNTDSLFSQHKVIFWHCFFHSKIDFVRTILCHYVWICFIVFNHGMVFHYIYEYVSYVLSHCVYRYSFNQLYLESYWICFEFFLLPQIMLQWTSFYIYLCIYRIIIFGTVHKLVIDLKGFNHIKD